ncbi:KGG domain-containing protein, partial [Bacillus velezensis]
TSNNHDKEFYQEIGQKGGEATSKNHDKEFYKEIGQKGGNRRSS